MRFGMRVAGAALAAPVLCATPEVAAAGTLCAARADLLALLARDYGEQPAAVGFVSDGVLIELTRDAEGRSWSLLVTTPEGRSCLIAAGSDWRARRIEDVETGETPL